MSKRAGKQKIALQMMVERWRRGETTVEISSLYEPNYYRLVWDRGKLRPIRERGRDGDMEIPI